MSEPVIKAVGMCCPKCKHLAWQTMLGDPWMHCSFCDVDTVEVYGPDALVRVALAVFEAPWRVNGETAEEAATRVVDRLTKGET